MEKPWWKSKTLWVNVLGVVAALLLLATKELELTEQAVGWVLFAWGGVNVVLRFVTDSKITR